MMFSYENASLYNYTGLKQYGKDWDRLEEMVSIIYSYFYKIPSRTNIQIRSHAQKFFERIKKEFNTEDPLEYVQKNMCDNSKVYNFDSYKDKEDSPSPNKRIFKMNRKNLTMLNDMQNIEDLEQQKRDNQEEHQRIFSIK